MSDLTPAEKWRRLMNPQTVEDYSIRMTAEEIAQVPEAAASMAQYLPLSASQCDLVSDMMRRAGETAERVRYGALMTEPPK